MTITPESIDVGRCYLVSTEWGERLRRVVEITATGFVEFEERVGPSVSYPWRGGTMSLAAFAFIVQREVPCDWRAEGDGGGP